MVLQATEGSIFYQQVLSQMLDRLPGFVGVSQDLSAELSMNAKFTEYAARSNPQIDTTTVFFSGSTDSTGLYADLPNPTSPTGTSMEYVLSGVAADREHISDYDRMGRPDGSFWMP